MRASLILVIALFALPSPAQEDDRAALPPPPIPPEGSESTQAQRDAQREAEADAQAEVRNQGGSEQARRPQPLPPKVEGEAVEPEVTIRREADRTVEEYSIQGRVFMIKIDPDNAPPYYIVDTDGDGIIDIDDDDRLTPVKPVQWKLFEWK